MIKTSAKALKILFFASCLMLTVACDTSSNPSMNDQDNGLDEVDMLDSNVNAQLDDMSVS